HRSSRGLEGIAPKIPEAVSLESERHGRVRCLGGRAVHEPRRSIMVALESDFSEAETLSVSCTRFVDEGSGREAAAPEVVPPRLFLQPGGSGEVRVKVMTTAPE